jgi:FlgD Ig-like domain
MRLPVAAFVALAVATIAAFFITQHLKISPPLLAGFPAPHPAQINPVDGKTCHGVSHRSMSVSFYLPNRSDDVNVYIVDPEGTIVKTLASGVHMRAGAHPARTKFGWDGRTAAGSLAPDGTYYIRVSLVHQGRSVLISNNAGPEPVTVETVPPRPQVTAITPGLISPSAHAHVTIHYTGTGTYPARIMIYRTGLPGGPRLVKRFAARRGTSVVWDGTIGGQPALPGTYRIGLAVTDSACNTGVSTAPAVVTVS